MRNAFRHTDTQIRSGCGAQWQGHCLAYLCHPVCYLTPSMGEGRKMKEEKNISFSISPHIFFSL